MTHRIKMHVIWLHQYGISLRHFTDGFRHFTDDFDISRIIVWKAN